MSSAFCRFGYEFKIRFAGSAGLGRMKKAFDRWPISIISYLQS